LKFYKPVEEGGKRVVRASISAEELVKWHVLCRRAQGWVSSYDEL